MSANNKAQTFLSHNNSVIVNHGNSNSKLEASVYIYFITGHRLT